MVNILYISYNDILGHLGQSQILPYLKGLQNEGYNFHLMSFERKHISKEQKELFEMTGIKWVNLKYHKKPSFIAKVYDIILGVIIGIQIVSKNRIGLIHARSYVPAFIGMLISMVTGAKLIFDMRGFMADEYADAGSWSRNSIKYKVLKYFEKILLSYSHEIITLTNEAKQILIKQFLVKKNITVIPCCVDIERFHEVDTDIIKRLKEEMRLENKTVIVYSGSIGGWYLTKEMIDFFYVCKENLDNSHFMLLSNNDQHLISDYMRQRNISTSSYTIMNVKPEDMPKYLAIADFSIAFIMPCFSKKGSSPIKFGEYLAMGLPIVTNTGIGDSDTMINDKVGYVIQKFDKQEYIKAIKHINSILIDKESLLEESISIVKNFLSLEPAIQNYKIVYNRLFDNCKCDRVVQ